jgi:hypothetical protein
MTYTRTPVEYVEIPKVRATRVGIPSDAGACRRLIPSRTEVHMYVIREVLNCKPGKVRQMVDKLRHISAVLVETGNEPLRLLTDVTGEPFWTVVAEAKVETVDDFFAVEQKLTANESLRKTMADYHELVDSGRREIFRIES